MTDPFSHPWLGGLFDDPDIAAVLSAEAELARMKQIERAWTLALGETGFADAEICVAAADYIDACQIDIADLRDGVARDGLPVPQLVRALRDQADAAQRDVIHHGLTSQDVIDTALMLALQQVFEIYRARLKDFDEAFAELRTHSGDRALMAHTRMQPALSVHASQKVDVWQHPFTAHLAALDRLAEELRVIQWGGPVGVRDPGYPAAIGPAFAKTLGLRDPGHAWHADRSGLADLAGWLARVSGSCGKVGQDIALLAQSGEITVSGGGTSSAMPHKNNPVLAELLVTLARYNAVQVSGMHHALIHEQERSGSAWALEWMILPNMLRCTGRSLSATTKALRQISWG